jgi:hypothetical protein
MDQLKRPTGRIASIYVEAFRVCVIPIEGDSTGIVIVGPEVFAVWEDLPPHLPGRTNRSSVIMRLLIKSIDTFSFPLLL